ncbi:uncharacterized protein LOC143423179 [Xylocopa sonorina]|uniref:uncharacterized protein LOC143423179 n=1 Tax=Xylocopa sonorina TaxID=1818115 RepID=UPI00403B07FD
MVELMVVTEPYRVLQRPPWTGDLDDSVVIAQSVSSRIWPIAPVARVHGFMAVNWAVCLVVGIYASPSWSLSRFDILLDELQIIVSFYMALTEDGPEGSLVDEVPGLGLRLLNQGSASTCVRYQGESIVDLSFANALGTRRVSGWRVNDVETLSSHAYIHIEVSTPSLTCPSAHHRRRWALNGMDVDALMAAVLAAAWPGIPAEPVDVNAQTDWFSDVMTFVCGVAMPCYTRKRRQRKNIAARTAQLYADYREHTKQLQLTVRSAKA